MAKFGLFGGNLPDPMQTVEGDRMKQEKEYVYIYADGPGDRTHQVGAIKLGDGQVVKKISE